MKPKQYPNVEVYCADRVITDATGLAISVAIRNCGSELWQDMKARQQQADVLQTAALVAWEWHTDTAELSNLDSYGITLPTSREFMREVARRVYHTLRELGYRKEKHGGWQHQAGSLCDYSEEVLS